MKKDVIVITGGASGIGRALVELYLKNGEKVIALDLFEDGLKSLRDWAKAYDYAFESAHLSVLDMEGISELVKNIEAKSERIKIWINSAGLSGIGEFKKIEKKSYDQILSINLLSIVDISRIVLRHMENEGLGTIVNISSVAGFVPAPLMSAYNLTKHALVGFTRSMQQEMQYTDSPVKFVLVCPGFVDTQMIKKGEDLGFPDWLSSILSTPERVANEIKRGIDRGKIEIFPTFNGKALLKMHSLFPHFTRSKAKLLTVKSLKDYLLNRH